MAWGGQGSGATAKNVSAAWKKHGKIERHLEKLRDGGLSRIEAYERFRGAGAIAHLGPAFFTKLLFFFDTSHATNPTGGCYIMDQWTARSVNLLTGHAIVKTHLAKG
jgi:hypothetical protein